MRSTLIFCSLMASLESDRNCDHVHDNIICKAKSLVSRVIRRSSRRRQAGCETAGRVSTGAASAIPGVASVTSVVEGLVEAADSVGRTFQGVKIANSFLNMVLSDLQVFLWGEIHTLNSVVGRGVKPSGSGFDSVVL